jgi:hypothetical protein
MARQLRFQYPDAVYHMMARGGGGKQLFLGKDDHGSFMSHVNSLINRVLKDPKARRALAKHERVLDSQQETLQD